MNFNIDLTYGGSECPPFDGMVFKATINNLNKKTCRMIEGLELEKVLDSVRDAIVKQCSNV